MIPHHKRPACLTDQNNSFFPINLQLCVIVSYYLEAICCKLLTVMISGEGRLKTAFRIVVLHGQEFPPDDVNVWWSKLN